MHIELIDTLRCPNAHEDTWLVGAFDRLIDRDIIEGRLGCPVCGATFPIDDGLVQFDADADPGTATVGADDALRLAAMLDLASPGGIVILEGAWALAGEMLASFIDARLLVMNPPSGFVARGGLSAIRSTRAVPVAPGSCRGIALHHGRTTEQLARAAVPALRAAGRLVAPANVAPPPDVRELARDASWWVAERAAPPPALVRLGRR